MDLHVLLLALQTFSHLPVLKSLHWLKVYKALLYFLHLPSVLSHEHRLLAQVIEPMYLACDIMPFYCVLFYYFSIEIHLCYLIKIRDFSK